MAARGGDGRVAGNQEDLQVSRRGVEKGVPGEGGGLGREIFSSVKLKLSICWIDE